MDGLHSWQGVPDDQQDVTTRMSYFISRSTGQTPTAPFTFSLESGPVLEMMQLRDLMRTSLQADTSRMLDFGNEVVLFLRTPRLLVASVSQSTQELIRKLCSGLPGRRVKVYDIGKLSPSRQARTMANAQVVVLVHGADLTNMIWMPPSGTVIEVTLRYGWCCDPIPPSSFEKLDDDTLPCTACTTPSSQGCPDYLGQDQCKRYHKADNANLATSLNLSYVYFDPEYVYPPFNENPISRRRVYVNAEELAALLAALLQTQR